MTLSTAMPNPQKTQHAERAINLTSLMKDLVAAGRLSQADLDQVVVSRRSKEQLQLHPIELVADFEFTDPSTGKTLDQYAVSEWLAEQAGQDYYHIDPLKIDVRNVTQVMSYEFANRHNILAVAINPDDVVIASCEPFLSAWEEGLRQTSRKMIRRVMVAPGDLKRYLVEFYTLAKSVSGAVVGDSEASSAITNFEQLLELGGSKDPDANDQHIVNIVDWLLQYAYSQRASDIHIEPRREQGNIRFRIDGILHTVYQLPSQITTAVVSRLKILGRMNIAEKRFPQDGRVKTKNTEGAEIELRLSTLPTAFGEKLVMRIFDPEVLLRSFQELGLVNQDYHRWQDMTTRPNGIILVTGPTGSGKTTTLYSTLKQLATSEVNVSTIEDPIEMVEPSFNQMQVRHDIDLNFADGVKALLRQDPDIIMVGEIRDLETAEMAVQAALTGHLVISTLHTNDAPSAITRLLELGVPDYLLKATVVGVMAQRLIRTLCDSCKETQTVDDEAWKTLTQPWRSTKPAHICKPVGCLECRDTGYRGRMGIYEVMPLSAELKQRLGGGDLADFRQQAHREGMLSLRLSGAQKVAAGLTTIEEILRVTPIGHE